MKVSIPNRNCPSLNKINMDLKEFFSKNSHDIVEYNIWPVVGKDEVYIQHFMERRDILKPLYKSILIQPIDGTVIKPNNVRIINQWDIVVTPSKVGKDIMINNGVTSKIEVIPNYWEDELLIDNEFFSQNFVEKKWTYYTESSGWDRKNIKNILKYFVEEFKDNPDVRLVIKLEEKKDLVIPDGIQCEIIIIDEFISKENIYSLMINCDCYVCLSYMEGFCIPLLNAAVLKKDIICLDSKISGYTDFLDKDNSIMISCSNIPIFKGISLAIYDTSSIWEEPDYSEYKMALRLSFEKKYQFNKVGDFKDFHKDVVMESYLKLIE
jgi:glycosyltransferase involved in cell wall biosynthesis